VFFTALGCAAITSSIPDILRYPISSRSFILFFSFLRHSRRANSARLSFSFIYHFNPFFQWYQNHVTPVAGLNLLLEKVSDSSNFS